MEKLGFSKKIQELSNKIGITLTDNQIEKFYTYMEQLIIWNKKINLTAITKPEEIIEKHFIDSITIEKYIKKNANLIDIGTGAGFPGIPLKIIREDLKITLVDSLRKRVDFLNEITNSLELNNINSYHGRAEEMGKNKSYREKFDYATSRAVANLSTLSEYLLPFVKKDGYVISMKGPNIEEELNNGKTAIKILGGKLKEIQKLSLPQSGDNRTIIFIEKIQNTPAKYPRKAGTPAKNPISNNL